MIFILFGFQEMSSALKKISIDELHVGMFVVEMDISWIKSPFLLHRREIKSKNDVILLKKAGVKILTVDLDKGVVNVEKQKTINEASLVDPDCESRIETGKIKEINAELLNMSDVPLKEEINRAIMLKEKALEVFKEINILVENEQPIPVKEFDLVINDAIDSLMRNSQALLTLMHLKRHKETLFSHSFSVMSLALTLAIKNKVPENELKILGLAALLHDIGWAKLPLNLFAKAKKYSENEIKIVQQHQKIASIIIDRDKNFPGAVKHIMMNHHERIDGSGYPGGLRGSQLDQLSNILILTDYYDELVHGLADRPGLIPSESLRFLYKEAEKIKLVKSQVGQLIKLLGIYPLTSAVELTSGEKGVVIEVNRDKPLIPIVEIMYNSDGNALAKPFIINLVKDKKKRQIKRFVDFSNDNVDPQNLLIIEDIS
ncbi:MAG: hypothetical protein DRQ43_01940 [Gammaproteobacteria bacterium]|nr:MAG: hypothetical protein DRQ43_01940 [Gammaproteobacteria bacterium]